MKNESVTENEGIEEVDPLLGVKVKTSWYPAARGWFRGRRRILGAQLYASNTYHVMSRTCGGVVFFDDVEKEALQRVLWRVAEFCGVKILTYCVMGNHFHVLASVPHQGRFLEQFEGAEGERRLLGHLRSLYSKRYVELLEADLRRWREAGDEVRVQQKLESFKGRMADLSRFVKEVKERFSRWYNKRHERKGTLWMDRFKSVLVEDKRGVDGSWDAERVDAVKAMAAYIDLNPVRAGLVVDARNYPWCGYGEACAGVRRAQRGLCRVLELPVDGWESHHGANGYLNLLQGVDWETGTRRSGGGKNATPISQTGGIQAKEGKAESRSGKGGNGLPQEGCVSLGALLRSRVREFSEGLVLGSQAFVDEVFQANRRFFGEKRKEGARRMRRSEVPFFVAKRTGETGSDGGH